MMINELNIGNSINLDNGNSDIIVGISKGWIELGNSGRKVRAKSITSINLLDYPHDEESDEDEDEPKGGRMAKTLHKYAKGYLNTVAASGRKSKANGDEVATALEGMNHLVVASLADKLLNEEPGYHFLRYGHLNNGAIRMNSGNRIRAAVKRGELDIETVIDATGK